MIWMERLTDIRRIIAEKEYWQKDRAETWDAFTRHMEMGELREYKQHCIDEDTVIDALAGYLQYKNLEEAGRLVVLPEGDGRTLFLKVLAYNDAICPSCLGLKGIPCNHETECMACWEAALKGGDLNE